ncbi:MAG: hypothetical protein A2283_06770 [Lentisphaerae bacterium RIFOXYA12_FULL_48_11]|nr:MAG: hypothetical protein A2283_06770 [Lentisphaerae bacterium RIFOXYA12_FULL_48_11]
MDHKSSISGQKCDQVPIVSMLGVDYWHFTTHDGGDIYVTKFGLPFAENLLPENWFEREWFDQNRERLLGTSTVYKVQTKAVAERSLSLVVKWCRVGEQVPFDTLTLNKFAMAEFNSPYEEFSLLMEMRDGSDIGRIRTHKPLAIYVPSERLKLWQTGRSESKIAQKKAKHRDIELDVYRQYILIYEWIKGASVVEVLDQTSIPKEKHIEIVEQLTKKATLDLATRGFRVLDMKPAHIIVRATDDKNLMTEPSGEIAYALVDFELLDRTPEHELNVKQTRRTQYLKGQSRRFGQVDSSPFPSHLHHVNIMGVDYVFGHTESTHGDMWVAGNLPALFDFFLPERWRRTKRVVLSKTNEVYYTKTKDNINIVWKISRVGEKPDFDPADARGREIIDAGYNSPFEEFALALELSRKGVSTVYPRAIYMTGLEFESAEYIEDPRRYERHSALLDPEGKPVLNSHHNYITIWGFWNGLDEMLAEEDRPSCEGINLDLACQSGYISRNDCESLMEVAREKLADAGMEDLNLKGDHMILSIDRNGLLVRDSLGIPDIRFCNFELMRKNQR